MANTHTTLVSLFDDIADAIRERAGSNSEIIADNFPNIIRNIPKTIIQSSKTVTPSTSKQTIVPDSGYDALGQVIVNAINGKVVKTGTYTPTSDIKYFSITHSLGVVPDFCLCCYEDMSSNASSANSAFYLIAGYNPILGYWNGHGFYCNVASSNKTFFGRAYDHTKSWSTLYNELTATSVGTNPIQPTCVSSATESKLTFGHGDGVSINLNVKFMKGVTYRWVVGKLN